jgi:hypothetical protein
VLAAKPERAPVVTVHDVTGKQIAAVNGRAVAGLQVLHYDGRVGTGPRGARIAPGNYSIRCRIGDQELVQPLVVEIDPTVPAAAAAAAAAADSAAEPTTDREGSR